MLSHYLLFGRNCSDALNVYSEAFNTEIIEIQRYGDMPPNPDFPVPDADKSLVLHSRLTVDGMDIMCADSSAQCAAGDNMYISITTKDGELALKAWDVLIADGKVYMELAPSFFAALHGSLRDKFGINWMFTVLN